VPSDKYGGEVEAAVVLKGGREGGKAVEEATHCHAKLAAYKCPRRLYAHRHGGLAFLGTLVVAVGSLREEVGGDVPPLGGSFPHGSSHQSQTGPGPTVFSPTFFGSGEK